LRYGTLYNRKDNQVIVPKVLITENWHERARGLLGRRRLAADEGMLISPCNSIHTFFMSYAIDVIYLDKEMTILKICSTLSPWRLSGCAKASMVLELPAQTAFKNDFQKGMCLSWQQQI
jgi:uncharacterized membrane protein (UPF0127 family)